ncbi:MAG: class II aldolase/adducin family protein [Proteobacteria bacterium]|nr:class II aldolase/adducin family protein [Pseudomonadota bacterium]
MTAALRAEVAGVYRDLGRLGLNTGSSGNVSARTRHGMVITPTGASAETIDAKSIVAMRLDGEVRKGKAPSSEWPMHAAIYAADPRAGAIVHTHADACTALACLNEGLPAFHYMIAAFGGADVRCAPYVTFGTPELAAAAAEAIAGRTACLLANHGMIVHGPTPRAALRAAVALETLCRQYLLARAAGMVRLLTDAEMDAAMRRFESYAAGKG